MRNIVRRTKANNKESKTIIKKSDTRVKIN